MAEQSQGVGVREALSFCRQCMGMCGTVVSLDEASRVVGVRGDREDPSTLGYACFKGLNAAEATHKTELKEVRLAASKENLIIETWDEKRR